MKLFQKKKNNIFGSIILGSNLDHVGQAATDLKRLRNRQVSKFEYFLDPIQFKSRAYPGLA